MATSDDLHRDFGRMEGRLDAVEGRLQNIEDLLKTLISRLESIEAREHERRGAVWLLRGLWGIATGAVGFFGSWLFTHLTR